MIDTLPPAAVRSDPPDEFIAKEDAWRVAMPTLVAQINAAVLAMNLNATTDTSASSVLIGTGAKTFTVSASKSFLGGMFLVIADTAAPSTNWMAGQVTSYIGTTLVMNILTVGGSGTKTAWTISQSATGVAGGAVVAGAGANADITSLSALTSVPLNLDMPLINGYVDWSISGNALTAAIKTYAGTDPSPTNPVFAVFRNPTLTSAGYYVRSITAALSVTASSGSTLGTVSAQASRIRAVLMDNAGTVVLGLYNPWNNTTKSLVGLQESLAYSSTAEGGGGLADSAQTIYTTSAQTSKAIREVSYMDSTQTTAGTWAQALTNEVQITATTPKTGSLLQCVTSATGALATGTTIIPGDDTIPQNTEGDQYMTQAITPSAAANLLEVDANLWLANTAVNIMYAVLFQDSTANALASSTAGTVAGANYAESASLHYTGVAMGVAATTFKIRAGGGAAGTTTFNGQNGVRQHGGVAASFLKVKEIMV
jgi:hypothetical protein